MNQIKKEDLQYDDSVKQNARGTAILGRLTGPCADIINPTRNGRKYSDELWKKVFRDPIVKEYFEAGGIFGELNHPESRQETDLTQVCVCMSEPPKEDKNGHLIGSWDILDTPNGRILKTLCDYGYKLGISSRGSGDVTTDYDGNEAVDPDTYEFKGFDVVYLPAVKAARLNYMTESLSNKLSFKQALTESLNNASDSDRKIMESTLDRLNINVNEDIESEDAQANDNVDGCLVDRLLTFGLSANQDEAKQSIQGMSDEEKKELLDKLSNRNIIESIDNFKRSEVSDEDDYEECNNPEDCTDIKEAEDEKDEEADDIGTDLIIEKLQETLKKNAELESKLVDLQKQLAVSDTKVSEINEELTRYKNLTVRLSNSSRESKALKEEVSKLRENLANKDKVVHRLMKARETDNSKVKAINEELSSKNAKSKTLEEAFNTYKKDAETREQKLKAEKATLEESIKTLRANSESRSEEYKKRLARANNLSEEYKKVAEDTVTHYINAKAVMLGVSSNEIRNRLSESYTIDEIDEVCEDLQSYALNMNKLPVDLIKTKKIKITESKINSLTQEKFDDGDDVDDSLLSLAGFDK